MTASQPWVTHSSTLQETWCDAVAGPEDGAVWVLEDSFLAPARAAPSGMRPLFRMQLRVPIRVLVQGVVAAVRKLRQSMTLANPGSSMRLKTYAALVARFVVTAHRSALTARPVSVAPASLGLAGPNRVDMVDTDTEMIKLLESLISYTGASIEYLASNLYERSAAPAFLSRACTCTSRR